MGEYLDRIKSYKGIYEEPPGIGPWKGMPEGSLMGNGDVGIVLAGEAHRNIFYISKSDFWFQAHLGETDDERLERLLNRFNRRTGTRIMTVGRIEVNIPRLKGGSYHMEQNILKGCTEGTIEKGIERVTIKSWICATENLFVIELYNKSPHTIEADIKLAPCEIDQNEIFHYDLDIYDKVMSFTRCANAGNLKGNREVTVTTRLMPGHSSEIEVKKTLTGVTGQLMIPAETKVVLTTYIFSDLDHEKQKNEAYNRLSTLNRRNLDIMIKKHDRWWQDFWELSNIDINDNELEKYYYTSLYVMACASRRGKVPPGLFGNFVTTDRPSWTGSYTLNYNYEAPYWGLYSSNRIDTAENYAQPLLDAIPLGKEFAQKLLNCRGIYLPVELGPWGTICSMLFHGQKSNASYGAVNMVMHYYYTYDKNYAKKVYPYIREVAEFWQDYLIWEDDRYVIYDDSIHEGSGSETNPILTIALIAMVMKAALDMSIALSLDPHQRDIWQHILNNLSGYPTYTRYGKQIFRLTKEGMDWTDRNSLAIQHIFPTGAIGLDSNPLLIDVAVNTLAQMPSWHGDGNAFPTIYAAAARVGWKGNELLDELKAEAKYLAKQNNHLYTHGGSMENVSGVTVTINEMLMQSHQNVIKLFPVWPKFDNASFTKLRAYGAFLVSAKLENGLIKDVIIISEKGRECTVDNPWPGRQLIVRHENGSVDRFDSDRATFNTEIGERIELSPYS